MRCDAYTSSCSEAVILFSALHSVSPRLSNTDGESYLARTQDIREYKAAGFFMFARGLNDRKSYRHFSFPFGWTGFFKHTPASQVSMKPKSMRPKLLIPMTCLHDLPALLFLHVHYIHLLFIAYLACSSHSVCVCAVLYCAVLCVGRARCMHPHVARCMHPHEALHASTGGAACIHT